MSGHFNKQIVGTARTPCRVPIFAPTRRASAVFQQFIKTEWGWATITGTLGQNHRDALDVLVEVAHRWRPEGTRGDQVALVDSTRFRAALGWKRWTYAQMLDVLRDLRAAEIRASFGEWTTTCGIITHIVESKTPPPERKVRPPKRKARPLDGANTKWHQKTEDEAHGGMIWEVTISGAWIALMQDLARYPINVVKMRYGVSQAITRFMLSHSPGAHYKIETVLEAVGMPRRHYDRAVAEMTEQRPARRYKKKGAVAEGAENAAPLESPDATLLPADADLMAAAGVQIDTIKGTIIYTADRPSPGKRGKAKRLDHPSPVADHPSPVADHPSPKKTTHIRSL